jgi:gliding motility-associated protein GldM
MGVKNCPETPRQRMINMMYIVLTAMLALNVASETLEAFRVIDGSLIQTMNAVDSKNKQVYLAFEQAYAENALKVQDWKIKADQVKARSDSMVNYIWKLKEQLVTASGSKKVDADHPYDGEMFSLKTLKGDTILLKKEDDINTPSEIMITQKRAAELKGKMADYKNFMVNLVDEGTDAQLKEVLSQELETRDSRFNLRSGDKKTWEVVYFENKPLASILTMLSKIQIDVKNSEANLLSYLYSKIDAASFKFNKLGAQVIANSAVILRGEEYKAEIFLAAIDTTVDPEIIVNGHILPIVEGKAVYQLKTNETGTFKWSGVLKYKTPAGLIQSYPFDKEYQVTAPGVTISPTKMNVFYRGIGNPVSISVPSIAKENLRIEMTNGKITSSGNEFIVFPADLDEQGKRTTVSVFARVGDGERLMGSMPFRVKKVPDPVAKIANLSGGNIKKEDLLLEDGILAVLVDFDFDLKFRITQFDVSLSGSGGYWNTWKSASNRFSPEQKGQFKNLAIGSVVYFDNIRAKGDDGTDRTLDPISFKIR